MEKNTGMANFIGKIRTYTRENGSMILFLDRVNSLGLMEIGNYLIIFKIKK